MDQSLKVSAENLVLLKQKDPTFLKQLFYSINPYLFKVLGSNQIFDHVAEDIIQNTWQVFFENIEAFEGRSQIKTYITGILINKVREHRRYNKKMMPEEDLEKIYQQSFTSDGWWINEPADPYVLLQSSQLLKKLEQCLDSLSQSQKEAFILKEIEQQNTSEICNILNVSVTHLGVLLHRAKEKLRLCLQGQSGDISS